VASNNMHACRFDGSGCFGRGVLVVVDDPRQMAGIVPMQQPLTYIIQIMKAHLRGVPRELLRQESRM
jgi:hypothetical protein